MQISKYAVSAYDIINNNKTATTIIIFRENWSVSHQPYCFVNIYLCISLTSCQQLFLLYFVCLFLLMLCFFFQNYIVCAINCACILCNQCGIAWKIIKLHTHTPECAAKYATIVAGKEGENAYMQISNGVSRKLVLSLLKIIFFSNIN